MRGIYKMNPSLNNSLSNIISKLKKSVLDNGFLMLKNTKHRLLYIIAGILVFCVFLIDFHPIDSSFPKKIIFLTVVVIILLIIFLSSKIHNNAFLIILAIGTIYAFTTPILDVPDESVHLLRSMYTSTGNLVLYENHDDKLQVSKDFDVIFDDMKENLYNNRLQNFKHNPETNSMWILKVTNAYSFISYIPQACGLFLGRLLHLNLFWIFYLGRLTNLLAYALLCRFAIKIIKDFKIPMFIVTLMPMAVYLAASYNQDSLSIGLIFVALALFVNLYLSPERSISIRQIALYAVLCCLIGTTKLPYVLLICLLIFISPKKFKSNKIYACTYLAVASVGVFSLLWFVYYSSISGYNAYNTIHDIDPKGQLLFLYQHKLASIYILGKAMLNFFPTASGLFYFGPLTYSSGEITLLYYIFIGSVLIFYFRKFDIPKSVRIGSFLVTSLICAVIWVSLYITWSKVGSSTVEGLQGRYFIGLFPLAALFINISPISVSLKEDIMEKYNMLFTCIPLYFLISVLALTLGRYY